MTLQTQPKQVSGAARRLLCAIGAGALAIIGAGAASAQVPDWQKGNVVSNIGAELDKLSNKGDMKPANGKVKGTNSNYLLTAYAAGTNHPQGLAWSEKLKSWIIAHDTRAGYGKSMYAICSTVTEKCNFNFMGKQEHPNGMQVIGDVLGFSVSDDLTYFMDIRNPAAPVRMGCLLDESGASETGGAIGIAWEPTLKVHVVSVGSGGSDNLYVSNGLPLDSPQCRFNQVYQSASDTKLTDNDLSTPGEGFSHLYYDTAKQKLVGVGGSYDADRQQLVYQYFSLQKSVETGNVYMTKEAPVYRKFADTPGGSTYPGPSLRYAGALRPFLNTFQVVLAPRTLTGGAALNYMEIDIYPTSNPCGSAGLAPC